MRKSYPTRGHMIRDLPRGSIGAEIGVKVGRFSRSLLRVVQPRLLWLVDIWCHQPASVYPVVNQPDEDKNLSFLHLTMNGLWREIGAGRVRVLCGDSVEMRAYVPDESLDWVYIDANPTYEAVIETLWAWEAKVKSGGIIAGHGYVKFEKENYGVIDAVDQFMRESGAEGPYLTDEPFSEKKRKRSWWYRKP